MGNIALICWLQIPVFRINPVFPIVAPIQVTRTDNSGKGLSLEYPFSDTVSFDESTFTPLSKSAGL